MTRLDNCRQKATQLAIVASAVAVALAENMNAEEQNIIGNFLVQVGSTILTIAAALQSCESAKDENSS